MKFTVSWLKQFLDSSASLEEITYALTDIGLEVEEVIDRSLELADFEVAEILEATPHLAADRLRVCSVATKDGIKQIVCGAPNARAGIKVVLAKVGTEIPNGKFKIKESEIRGVKSQGMLCSEEELLIGSGNEGIIELPEQAIIGEKVLAFYGLDDPMIHINVTPNRGDALGVYGIARDLAARNIGKLKELVVPTDFLGNSTTESNLGVDPVLKSSRTFKYAASLLPESPANSFSVASCLRSLVKEQFHSDFKLQVEEPSLCPLFAIREIKGLQNKASPDWLKKLLANIGVSSISAVVDVTNYICYSFGQPMHAYDADKLAGGLTIGLQDAASKFKALNEKEYDVQPKDLIIKDSNAVQCLAGIIGGLDSGCSANTSRIILEAACFDAKTIARAGRHHQIHTDSRHRFERGIDQAFTLKALELATDMILSICGGEPSQIIVSGNNEVTPKILEVPLSAFNEVIPWDKETLEKLGFICDVTAEVARITVPTWRHDVSIKEDIMEEIARMRGYDKIVAVPLPNTEIARIIPRSYKRILDTKRVLANQGYDEVVTWSFMDGRLAEKFGKVHDELFLQNPISSDLDYMRPSIIPNLLKALAKNHARSIKDVALFELGPVFQGTLPADELTFAAGVRSGYQVAKNSLEPARLVDVFDVKADLQAVLSYLGFSIDKCQIVQNAAASYYHPTRSANLVLGKNILATFGQLHPTLLSELEIDVEVVAFELNLANIPVSKPKFGKREEFAPSDFQAVSRDYAFVAPKEQPVGELLSYIQNIDKKLIKSVELFDIYTGDKVPEGTKSIAISVQMQAAERTLNEEDLTNLSNNIILSLEQKFKVTLRK